MRFTLLSALIIAVGVMFNSACALGLNEVIIYYQVNGSPTEYSQVVSCDNKTDCEKKGNEMIADIKAAGGVVSDVNCTIANAVFKL